MNIGDIDPQSLENAGQLATNVAKSYLGQKFLKLVANRFKRRDAKIDAQANITNEKDKALALAEAEAEAELLKFTTELKKGDLLANYINRSGNRLISEQIRKDFNLDNAFDMVAEQIVSEAPIQDTTQEEDKTVSEDWFTRWTSIVEDISETEVQQMWAKILAGEIRKPGSFSGRSFDIVRNLSKVEAEAFMKLCKYVIATTSNDKFVFAGDEGYEYISIGNKLILPEIMLLEEAGLIGANSVSPLSRLQLKLFNTPKKDTYSHFIFGNVVYQIYLTEDIASEFNMPVITLTKAGKELHNVINGEVDMDLLASIKMLYASKTTHFIMSVHDITSKGQGGVKFKIDGAVL